MSEKHRKSLARQALRGLWDRHHDLVRERFDQSAVLFRVEEVESSERSRRLEASLSAREWRILEAASGQIASLEEPCWIFLKNCHDNAVTETRWLEPFSESRFQELLGFLSLPEFRASQDGVNELGLFPEHGRWLLYLREEPGFEVSLELFGLKPLIDRARLRLR